MSILQDSCLGLLETQGLTAAIEASDAMCKAANVTVLHVRRVGGARMCILFTGELGACEAALEAGAIAAQTHGKVTGRRVIARPPEDVARLVENFYRQAAPAEVAEQAPPEAGHEASPKTAPAPKNARHRKKSEGE